MAKLTMTVTVDVELYNKVLATSTDEKVNVSKVVSDVLRAGLEKLSEGKLDTSTVYLKKLKTALAMLLQANQLAQDEVKTNKKEKEPVSV